MPSGILNYKTSQISRNCKKNNKNKIFRIKEDTVT